MAQENRRVSYVCEEFGRGIVQKAHFRSVVTRVHGSVLNRAFRTYHQTRVKDLPIPLAE